MTASVPSLARHIFTTSRLAELGASITTHGPDGCFGSLLFIEKEGFSPLLERAKLAERYDIAIMSSKGMSVTAARELADQICSRCKIPLLVLHDFDIAGFSIGLTVSASTRRYTFDNPIKVIDLGLRLKDVKDLDLESESVSLGNAHPAKIRDRLRRNGATSEEIEFLLNEERVELNAMTSDVFIQFIEGKLEEHGVMKVVPAKERLAEAFKLFYASEQLREDVEEAPWSSAVRHFVEQTERSKATANKKCRPRKGGCS
jgi:hypothetical protein